MTPIGTSEIRAALTEVRDATEVPALDRVAFQARVRAERRRRTAGRVLVAGAAAAAVATVAGLATGLGGADRVVDRGPADDGAATATVGETVYFVLDGRLAALDPAGRLHDLGVRSEGVVGWTSERVYALDDDSRLVVRAVSYDDEGSGRASFATEPSPVTEPVQTVALSDDGRYLAWTDLVDVSHRYDLVAEAEDLSVPGDPATSAVDVGPEGLLLASDDDLVVHGIGAEVPVPTGDDAPAPGSQLGRGRVLVTGWDRDGAATASLYDISSGTAELVDTVAGRGVLAPDADRVALLHDPDVVPEGRELEVWAGGTARPVTGLGAEPYEVRWADESTLLVSAHDGGGGSLWACGLDLACDRLPVSGEIDLNR